MHPHLHIHIPIQTQAHTYSKHQNKTGIIVFFFKTCTDLYIIKFPSNILTIVVFLYKISLHLSIMYTVSYVYNVVCNRCTI